MGEFEVLIVINRLDLSLALGNVVVVVDVVGEKAFLLEVRHCRLHHLVEDVVRPLHLLLEGDPGLLQQVGLYVAPSQLSLDVEMDPDELSLQGNNSELDLYIRR